MTQQNEHEDLGVEPVPVEEARNAVEAETVMALEALAETYADAVQTEAAPETEPVPQTDDTKTPESPEEEVLFIPPATARPENFARYTPPFSTEKLSYKFDAGQVLRLPGAGLETVTGVVADYLNTVADDDLDETWQEAMMGATEFYPRNDTFVKAIQRPQGDWAGYVPHEDLRLLASRPAIGKSAQGQALTGAAAMARMASYTSLGSIIQIPLWRSGFWVTIKAPSDGALMELERRLMMERMVFGRLTRGMTFSQSEVHIKSAIVDFLLDCVIETTLWSNDPSDIAEAMKLADINTLIWGGALAIYPNGYPYVQPCTASPGECAHVATGKVAIHRLLFVDNNALTDRQRGQMARRKAKITREDYEAYQEEFATKESSYYSYKNIGVRFRDPSYAQYRDAGYEWVAELEAATERAFGNRISANERDATINNAAKAVAMRQYSHWVERITFLKDNGDDDGFVEARKDINGQLEMLTGDSRRSSKFYEKVGQFIADNAVSVVGVPNYVCPSCRKRQPTTEGRFEEIIPIEVGQTFFTLLTQKGEARRKEESI